MASIRTAIHLHTRYSWDSNLTPQTLVRLAHRAGYDCIAITDHNEIDGALEARAIGEVRVIIGEEITTTDGHLIGLFLQRRIAPDSSAEDTIAEIHAQGGVALAPHPFATLCKNSLQEAAWRLAALLDAVEVFNARNLIPADDARAADFAKQTGLTAYVGMDAHFRWLPATYQLMPEFSDSRSFLRSLRQAELHTARVGIRYYATMAFRRVWNRLHPNPPPIPGTANGSKPEGCREDVGRPVVQQTRLG